MTTQRNPWWMSFLPKKKAGGPKDTHTIGPDFDPFATRPEKQNDPATASCKNTGDQSHDESRKGSSLLSDDRYDDSHLDSVFNEQTCRRNMKISRSGRYKEKRRIRISLPIEEKETENGASGKEDVR